MTAGPRPPQEEPRTLAEVIFAERAGDARLEKDWADLVQAIADGDQRALHALFERTHRLVFTVIMRITRNRQGAEELTLDVFHDLWRKASRYDPEAGPVLGWILIQARSRALDRLRHERREKRVAGAEDWRDESVVLNSEEMVAKRQAGRALREALSALTAGELLAIETAYFSELSYTEAAERLGEPVGTVKTRIRSGLTKLRKVLVCEEDP